MTIPRGLGVILAFATVAALAWAQEPAKTAVSAAPEKTIDLTKIERKILREPDDYVGKKQQYCLLVFGPEAKFRVWLVHDADILYVDRNGDGRIGQRGERIVGNHTGHFQVGSILDNSNNMKHTSLFVTIDQNEGSLRILIGGKISQTAEFSPSEKPGDAPIVHLNGPVSLWLREPQEIKLDKAGQPSGVGPKNVLRRGRDVALSGFLETPGLNSFARYQPRDVLPKARLTIELQFSTKGADSARANGVMTHASFEGDFEMEGRVRVPDNAPLGQAELRVAFPENKEVSLVPPFVRKIRIYDK
ncbi:MAG: hypothetical protein L0Y72_21150 [Gemmataceae bacterium]|nr:hypothetical protein [Gemmataceae bacterium]MCI0741550.1 hypothetical protein [Gemmataceae bacterium]